MFTFQKSLQIILWFDAFNRYRNVGPPTHPTLTPQVFFFSTFPPHPQLLDCNQRQGVAQMIFQIDLFVSAECTIVMVREPFMLLYDSAGS